MNNEEIEKQIKDIFDEYRPIGVHRANMMSDILKVIAQAVQQAKREALEKYYQKLFKEWDARYYTDDNIEAEDVRLILIEMKEELKALSTQPSTDERERGK